jgi:hypothetical protein
MIEVSVRPSHLGVGRQTSLKIVLVNVGRGPCSDIDLRLELPSGIALLEGRSRVEVPSLPAGETHTHEVVVQGSRSGDFELTRRVFSYRDQYGVPTDGADLRCKLLVTGGSDEPPPPREAPRLTVRVEADARGLSVGTWAKLKILARNPSNVPLDDVVMELHGALRINGRRSRITRLGPGGTGRFTFDVFADESGQVPVEARTTFTYPERLGSIRQGTQGDGLQVQAQVVRDPTPEPAKASGTILYLTASPKDPDLEWVPLRSDLEMRRVKERLKLSGHPNQYRIEPCPAARWDDVSQALVDYDPQVVHFSGHGDSEGNLMLEKDDGSTAQTTPQGLARLFGLHRSTIKCMIVNACYSERLARALSQDIDYVIGMRCQIGDEAAIQFSVGFYMGLFAGQPVPVAFERGLAHIQGPEATAPEFRTPLLLTRPPA